MKCNICKRLYCILWNNRILDNFCFSLVTYTYYCNSITVIGSNASIFNEQFIFEKDEISIHLSWWQDQEKGIKGTKHEKAIFIIIFCSGEGWRSSRHPILYFPISQQNKWGSGGQNFFWSPMSKTLKADCSCRECSLKWCRLIKVQSNFTGA